MARKYAMNKGGKVHMYQGTRKGFRAWTSWMCTYISQSSVEI
jgi:hypothetical protein